MKADCVISTTTTAQAWRKRSGCKAMRVSEMKFQMYEIFASKDPCFE